MDPTYANMKMLAQLALYWDCWRKDGVNVEWQLEDTTEDGWKHVRVAFFVQDSIWAYPPLSYLTRERFAHVNDYGIQFILAGLKRRVQSLLVEKKNEVVEEKEKKEETEKKDNKVAEEEEWTVPWIPLPKRDGNEEGSPCTRTYTRLLTLLSLRTFEPEMLDGTLGSVFGELEELSSFLLESITIIHGQKLESLSVVIRGSPRPFLSFLGVTKRYPIWYWEDPLQL